MTVTHVGFADESQWNTGRFRSLALVTCPIAAREALESEVIRLLADSNVTEFKWKDVAGARERFAAEKLCGFAVSRAIAGQLRVDELGWDIEDSRHKVAKRDDIANLERMYYHLLRNVMRRRWPNNAVWCLHPDEHTALDWETLQDCLEGVGSRIELECTLFTGGNFRLRLRREFGVEEIRPVPSGTHPLLQVADLFAGLAVFSRQKYNDYQKWKGETGAQTSLFDRRQGTFDPSRRMRQRSQILSKFDQICKSRKLGVSLKTRAGLWTPNPNSPINFWMYEPQQSEDKAPQKGST